jgi:hypothetical protein
VDTRDQQLSQNRHIAPSHFFEEIFEPFIHQSRNIEIRYQVHVNNQAKEVKNDIVISSVNECKTPEEFRLKLTTILESSLDTLFLSLQQTSSSSWSQIIGFIQYRLQVLTSIISDELIILPRINGNFAQSKSFKSFSNCNMIPSDQSDFCIAGQWIRFKSEKFAEVWLQVIDEAVRRCGLIHESLKKTLITVSDSSEIEGSVSKYSGLKFNLSVPQLAYFLYLLVKVNVIDLPLRGITMFLNWVVRNFQSKGQESIQFKSFRNKFTTPDPSAIDSVKTILKKMLAKIEEDQERLSK